MFMTKSSDKRCPTCNLDSLTKPVATKKVMMQNLDEALESHDRVFFLILNWVILL